MRELAALRSIRHLQIWTEVKRQDMPYVIGIPGLRYLDVLGLRGRGRLSGLSRARFERFGSYDLTARDLIDIATCRSLRAIWAHGVKLTMPAIDALLRLPALSHLDLEGSNFSDAHAARLSGSRLLRHLDVGATPLTGAGLQHLCRMKQLRELDVWAAMIDEPDVEHLAVLPRLEYLAIGQRHDENRFNAQTLVPRLRSIRGLKFIWLDGIKVSRQLTRTLESRYASVRITD
jgi:hypothetical protein